MFWDESDYVFYFGLKLWISDEIWYNEKLKLDIENVENLMNE